jgi:hypothetical protein
MRVITECTPEQCEKITELPISIIADWCKKVCAKIEINNGRITNIVETHRDYVWKTDGRNSYK